MLIMTELESLIALNMIEGLGPVTIRRLVEHFGSAEKALQATEAELRRVEGIGPEMAARVINGRKAVDVSAEIEKIGKERLTIIPFTEPAYPEPLKQIYDPPPLLYVKGELKPEDRHAIAVVGARRCSSYGVSCAERLAAQLVGVGLIVVSGLARGIDTAAHRGALKAKGRTIAVLGSGLNRIYPPENRELAGEIASAGAVISEFPMDTGPQRTNFPLRNRLVSGLSLGVVVVEAARKSGALITAAQALEQGRTVFAVPGRIDSFTSRGTHALIKDGAKLVESIEDICQEFPYLFPAQEAPASEEGGAELPRPKLTPEEEAVFGTLSSEERSIDEIIEACALSPASVSASLLSLEIKHLVIQLPGKMFRRAL
jgi:DNA processing protein